jgi:hypothetical protein
MEIQGSEEQIGHVLQILNEDRYIRIRSMDVQTIPVDESEKDFGVKFGGWF